MTVAAGTRATLMAATACKSLDVKLVRFQPHSLIVLKCPFRRESASISPHGHSNRGARGDQSEHGSAIGFKRVIEHAPHPLAATASTTRNAINSKSSSPALGSSIRLMKFD